MKKIHLLVFFSFLLVECVFSAVTKCQRPFSLHIIHHNDFHARFEETSDDSLICHHENGTCYGGFPRMVYEIEAIRRQYPGSLLLDAGDTFQGTYWYTDLKWNVTAYAMNLLDHDAHAIGNHEFDDDIEGLVPYLANLKAPAVAANLDSSDEPTLQGLYKPHVIVEREGRKIGIIGITTPSTKELEPTGKVKFTDPKEAAYRQSKYLNDNGVDIIILLSHCGYPLDVEIATGFGQYIDVIVGGHSHRDRRHIFPYLTKVKKTNETHEVIILQADAFTKFLGNVSIDFDEDGNAINWAGGPIELVDTIPEDQKTKEKLAPYAKEVHEAGSKVIGFLSKDMSHYDCLRGECLMGNLLTDAMRYIAQKEANNTRNYISIVQRSNMRAILSAGDFVQSYVVELFPYMDYLESFQLQGKYIYEFLERSVSDLMKGPGFTAPWLLQVSGLQVIYNITKPEGERVEAVFVTYETSREPLDCEQIYDLVSPNYLSKGGDGYTMIRDNKINPQTMQYDQKALREFIHDHPNLDVNIEGRIVVLS